MKPVVISGTGLFTPPYSISNDELVTAYNAYVELFNAEQQLVQARLLRTTSAIDLYRALGGGLK